MWVLAFLPLVLLGAAGAPPPPDTAELALLTDAASTQGAVFLDGSPAARYIVRGDPARWLIYQQGGGWCSSMPDCAARANSTLGSSKTYALRSTTVMQEQAYLSNDPAANPLFHNFTRVYLPYGDGTSQLGDVFAPVVVAAGAPPIYFRGARVLRAVIAFLRAEGLAGAKEVVVSGCSAGGLSTYAHADTWAAALPGARVVAMPDSGCAALGSPARARAPSAPSSCIHTHTRTHARAPTAASF